MPDAEHPRKIKGFAPCKRFPENACFTYAQLNN